ncbi:MAG: ankyrin repeat domain-containing protein [Candidatus Xenobiia bacterium LiM19]
MNTFLRVFIFLLLISLISSPLLAATIDERVLLFDAVTRGDAGRAREILEKSPDVAAAAGYRERSLAEEALWTGSCEVMEVLLSHGVPLSEDILPLAATFSRVEMIDLLLKHGAKINGRSREGYTALYNAAWSGRLELVRFLLEKGADTKIGISDGRTILHSVVSGEMRYYTEIAELLVQHGAEVNGKDSKGRTPLAVSCSNGSVEVINFLCRHGASIDTVDEAGVGR